MACLCTWFGTSMRHFATSGFALRIIFVIGRSLLIWMIVFQMQHPKSWTRELSSLLKCVFLLSVSHCFYDMLLITFRSDATCIICREEMTTAKRLSCGHLFHVQCLRSWLERQHTCPTCRAPVAPPENETSTSGSWADAHRQGNHMIVMDSWVWSSSWYTLIVISSCWLLKLWNLIFDLWLTTHAAESKMTLSIYC